MDNIEWFFTAWVVFGVLIVPYLKYQIEGELTVVNLIAALFVGAFTGFVGIIAGLLIWFGESDFSKKVIFKKK